MPCSECGNPCPSTDPRAHLCGPACKQRRWRRLHKAREAQADAARRLLIAQTEAIIAGSDPVVMTALADEARRVFGADGQLRGDIP